jgi:hypothetical protein
VSLFTHQVILKSSLFSLSFPFLDRAQIKYVRERIATVPSKVPVLLVANFADCFPIDASGGTEKKLSSLVDEITQLRKSKSRNPAAIGGKEDAREALEQEDAGAVEACECCARDGFGVSVSGFFFFFFLRSKKFARSDCFSTLIILYLFVGKKLKNIKRFLNLCFLEAERAVLTQRLQTNRIEWTAAVQEMRILSFGASTHGTVASDSGPGEFVGGYATWKAAARKKEAELAAAAAAAAASATTPPATKDTVVAGETKPAASATEPGEESRSKIESKKPASGPIKPTKGTIATPPSAPSAAAKSSASAPAAEARKGTGKVVKHVEDFHAGDLDTDFFGDVGASESATTVASAPAPTSGSPKHVPEDSDEDDEDAKTKLKKKKKKKGKGVRMLADEDLDMEGDEDRSKLSKVKTVVPAGSTAAAAEPSPRKKSKDVRKLDDEDLDLDGEDDRSMLSKVKTVLPIAATVGGEAMEDGEKKKTKKKQTKALMEDKDVDPSQVSNVAKAESSCEAASPQAVASTAPKFPAHPRESEQEFDAAVEEDASAAQDQPRERSESRGLWSDPARPTLGDDITTDETAARETAESTHKVAVDFKEDKKDGDDEDDEDGEHDKKKKPSGKKGKKRRPVVSMYEEDV